MNHDVASSRYAKALELAAGESVQMAQRIARELMLFSDHFQHGLGDLMTNPAFSPAERRRVLEKLCDERNFLPVTRNLLSLLLKHSRMHLFPDIFRMYRVRLDERMGRIQVSVISSHPLPADLFTEYRRRIHEAYGESALVRQEVDPDLVGGVLIRVGNKLVDGTLRGSIQRFCGRLNINV